MNETNAAKRASFCRRFFFHFLRYLLALILDLTCAHSSHWMPWCLNVEPVTLFWSTRSVSLTPWTQLNNERHKQEDISRRSWERYHHYNDEIRKTIQRRLYSEDYSESEVARQSSVHHSFHHLDEIRVQSLSVQVCYTLNHFFHAWCINWMYHDSVWFAGQFYSYITQFLSRSGKWHEKENEVTHDLSCPRTCSLWSGQVRSTNDLFDEKRDSQAGLFGSLEIMIKVMMTTVIVVLHFPHFVDDHQLVLLVMIITVMTVDFKYNNELLRKICDKILEPQEQKET